MKLVIDIDDSIKSVIDKNGTNEIVDEALWQATKNGIPVKKAIMDIHGKKYSIYMECD